MPNRKWTYGILISLLALVLISANIIRSFQKQELKVIFLNVGQGDSILISKGTNQILIDGGPSGTTLLSEAGKYIPFWDRKIELIIETHPDQDHIQGLVDVFKHYQVKKVIKTENESQSQVFKTLQDLIEKEKIEVINGTGGVSLKLAGEIQGDIIYPSDIKTGKDTNENSVVLKLKTEKSSFLFTGDLPTSSEAEIISKGIDINADYLKVAHHGSKYATSAEFLEKVKPKEAIISVGKNSYGHPSQEALDRLKKENIPVLRTDEEGDIIFICPREERCYRQI
jgi:competence protein ComEC